MYIENTQRFARCASYLVFVNLFLLDIVLVVFDVVRLVGEDDVIRCEAQSCEHDITTRAGNIQDSTEEKINIRGRECSAVL